MWEKKQGYGDTHQRAAASRLHCTLTHETGRDCCHLRLPRYTSVLKYTPLPASISFYSQLQIYTALGAPGKMALTLWGRQQCSLGQGRQDGEQQNANEPHNSNTIKITVWFFFFYFVDVIAVWFEGTVRGLCHLKWPPAGWGRGRCLDINSHKLSMQ